MDGRSFSLLDDALGLDVWDAEGGGARGTSHDRASRARDLMGSDQALLCRLGSALIGEWSGLSMPLRRALYRRAVDGRGVRSLPVLKRRMAKLLHDHQDRPGGV